MNPYVLSNDMDFSFLSIFNTICLVALTGFVTNWNTFWFQNKGKFSLLSFFVWFRRKQWSVFSKMNLLFIDIRMDQNIRHEWSANFCKLALSSLFPSYTLQKSSFLIYHKNMYLWNFGNAYWSRKFSSNFPAKIRSVLIFYRTLGDMVFVSIFNAMWWHWRVSWSFPNIGLSDME